MAFLAYSDIAAYLPIGHNQSQVERWLVLIESELKREGMTFTTPTTATRKLIPSDDGQRIFDFNFLTAKPTTVKVKKFGSSLEVIYTEDVDYRIIEHINIDGLYWRIEVDERNLIYPEYLEVNGSWGFMSSVPADLQAVIIEYLSELASQELEGGAKIAQASTADSDVRYADKSIRVIPRSILQYDKFQPIFRFYSV